MYFIDSDKITDIPMKNIKFSERILMPYKEIINIYFKDEDTKLKQIYIKTPTLILPWNKIMNNDENVFNIELCDISTNISLQCKPFLKDLENQLLKIYKKYLKSTSNNLTCNHKLEKNDLFKRYTNDCLSIRFFNVKKRDVKIFDTNGSSIDINNILKDDIVKCLFFIQHIWFKDDKCGFNIQLIQLMRIDTNLCVNSKNHLLESNCSNHNYTAKNSNKTNISSNNQSIDEYMRMKRIGLPIQVIKSKLLGDLNLSQLEKDKIMKTIENHTENSTNVSIKIDESMQKTNIKDIVENKSEKSNEKPMSIKPAFNPPSLNDILMAKSRLVKNNMTNK